MAGPLSYRRPGRLHLFSRQRCYNPMNTTVPNSNILPKVRCKDRKIHIYVFDKLELADKGNDVVLPLSPKICVNHTLILAIN